MQIIKNIRIKYFRSILSTTRGHVTELPTKDLNIIVGSNDAGKSNYLKALNLFFNGESDPGVAFNFWRDFSVQKHGVKKEKNYIVIALTISPPRQQHFQHRGDIVWEKSWEMKGGNLRFKEDFRYISGAKFNATARSSFYKWLRKIKYRYVPAIKSQKYFDNLMFDLYDVFQKDTKQLEGEFNKQVRDKTSELTTQLNRLLGLDSVLQFKGTFKDLFNKFEFGSSDGRSMLSQRGDGIKVRHIPVILQSLAEEELKEERKREPIASTIWGFEEPENNLEFISARNLAQSFLEYTHRIHFGHKSFSRYDEGIQIFLTTHSPIFYTLGKSNHERTQTFLVNKKKDNSSSIRTINKNESHIIEDTMQLAPLVALSNEWEKVSENLARKEELEKELKTLKESISDAKDFIFFTEDSDKTLSEILFRANGFSPDKVEVRSYKTCSNIASIKILHDFMIDRFGDRCPKLIVHRDRDYLSDTEIENEKRKFREADIQLFITEGTDIESYFVRENHLAHCCNGLNKEEIEEIIKKAIEKRKKVSVDTYLSHNLGPRYKKNNTVSKKLLLEHFEENSYRLFHGKEVYREVKNLFQMKTGRNLSVEKESAGLLDKELQRIASELKLQD